MNTDPETKWSESLPEPQKSRVFMQQPGCWPNLLLPVKRPAKTPGQFPELGFLTGNGPHVYLGCVFFGTQEALTKLPLKYATYDDLVADGWRVD